MMPMTMWVPMQCSGFRESKESEFNTAGRPVSSEWSEDLGKLTITQLDIAASLARRDPPSQLDRPHQALSEAVPGCLGSQGVL